MKFLRLQKNSKEKKRKLIIYACTSSYPAKDIDINLFEIHRTQKNLEKLLLWAIRDITKVFQLILQECTLGAEWIERHFTLDRTMKGTDHSASLEPDGIRRLNRDLNTLENVLKI